jgi:hypothetical protein
MSHLIAVRPRSETPPSLLLIVESSTRPLATKKSRVTKKRSPGKRGHRPCECSFIVAYLTHREIGRKGYEVLPFTWRPGFYPQSTFHRLREAAGHPTVAAHAVTSGIGGGGAPGGDQGPSVSHNATPVTSPIRSAVSLSSSTAAGKKRNVVGAGFDSSPGSIDDGDDADQQDEKRRQPVKRACNECRQQKVSSKAYDSSN